MCANQNNSSIGILQSAINKPKHCDKNSIEQVLALTIVTIVVTRHRSSEKPWTIVRLWFGPRDRHGSVFSQQP